MLHITLADHDLENLTERQLFDRARGDWVLGPRADREHYALVTVNGTVRMAIEIHSISTVVRRDTADTRDDRRRIEGWALGAGHPVYDEYVGKPSPALASRNPIKYLDEPVGAKPCACGCGGETGAGEFIAGHDQRALHARVAKVGTVKDFIEWFDAVSGPFENEE